MTDIITNINQELTRLQDYIQRLEEQLDRAHQSINILKDTIYDNCLPYLETNCECNAEIIPKLIKTYIALTKLNPALTPDIIHTQRTGVNWLPPIIEEAEYYLDDVCYTSEWAWGIALATRIQTDSPNITQVTIQTFGYEDSWLIRFLSQHGMILGELDYYPGDETEGEAVVDVIKLALEYKGLVVQEQVIG
ncbi:hypothetical protein [Pantanalinema sp. GBBB05]|uniref:hypothetical protein n=1 Tax=Pantanalinema sp. GBBB05 TaxID=2604139 RepID=UPI001D8CB604|nr:hypothetical protein [Pantanalinema sp. GBBB05]